jgi:hemolysin activation/secretion protein
MMNTRLAMTALLVASVLPVCGRAQTVPQLPSTAQPGAIERERSREPQPRAPEQLGRPVDAPAPPQPAPPGAEAKSFNLASIEISGNTAVLSDTLLAPYASLRGTTISVARIYGIAAEMTAVYRNRGYILSSVVVPPQDLQDGRVKLVAVEGYLAAVKFTGSTRRPGMLESIRRALLQDKPLRARTLERELLLLNDLPGLSAQGFLAPAASQSGASELTIHLEQRHLSVGASGSNRGSRLQGPYQYGGNIGLQSVLALDEATGFDYLQASNANELRYYSATHKERLTASGLDLDLFASRSDSAPDLGVQLTQLNLATDTRLARVGLSYPLIRSRAVNLSLHGALSYEDAHSDIPGFTLSRDRISAAHLGLTWDNVDEAAGVNRAELEFSRGLAIFGASPSDDPLASRLGGRPEFSKITTYLARLQSLSHSFSALLAFSGQYAMNRPLAPEEFSFGGEYFGRAYDPSELVGASGLVGKLEIRYTLDHRTGLSLTPYAFAEKGYVWQRLDASEVGLPRTDHATSVGGGLRVGISRWVTGYVEVAKPTDHIVAAEGNQKTRVFGGLATSLSVW